MVGDGEFVCELCGKHFVNATTLKRHNKTIHSSHNYDCDECIKTFNRQWSLKRHKERLHNPKRVLDDDKSRYENILLEGKNLLQFLVEECVPVAVMPEEDMAKINVYRKYIYQMINTYKDDYVPL